MQHHFALQRQKDDALLVIVGDLGLEIEKSHIYSFSWRSSGAISPESKVGESVSIYAVSNSCQGGEIVLKRKVIVLHGAQ